MLFCLASFYPTNLFSTFVKANLIEFTSFYPHGFSPFDLEVLDNQLETYNIDMHRNVEFASLKGLEKLSEKLDETGRYDVYPLVYLILKLTMILLVATATVERAFFCYEDFED